MHFPVRSATNQQRELEPVSHLVNRSAAAKSVCIESLPYRTTGGDHVKPMWLDIDGCLRDSEYTIPVGYSTPHVVDLDGQRAAGRGIGHLHDVDITPEPVREPLSRRRATGSPSRPSWWAAGTDYFGPIPPNNSPPASLTGATMCRSEGYYGTAVGRPQWRGHLDTMSQCGITTDPAGRAGGVWPDEWRVSLDGYKINAGQVIRLHSEYQNDTGQPQTDAMGIMVAVRAHRARLPAAAGRRRHDVAGAGLQPVHDTQPGARTTDFPGTASNRTRRAPRRLALSQLTTGSPDANGPAANSIGSAKFAVLPGDTGDDGRRGRRAPR